MTHWRKQKIIIFADTLLYLPKIDLDGHITVI